MFQVPAKYIPKQRSQQRAVCLQAHKPVLRPGPYAEGESAGQQIYGGFRTPQTRRAGKKQYPLALGKPGTSHDDWSIVICQRRKAQALTAGEISR